MIPKVISIAVRLVSAAAEGLLESARSIVSHRTLPLETSAGGAVFGLYVGDAGIDFADSPVENRRRLDLSGQPYASPFLSVVGGLVGLFAGRCGRD
jgi:hypothetical protein